MKNFQRATLACSVSVIAVLCNIAPASAATIDTIDGSRIERVSETADINVLDSGSISISAPLAAKVSFEKTMVTTVAAPPPVVEAPAPEAAQSVAPVAAPQAAAPQTSQARVAAPVAAAAIAPAPARAVAAPAPVAAPAAAPVSASGKGAAIAAAALGQLGVGQDCTALVSNSLRAVGINFHSAPAGYLSLGSVVPASQAQPGDLIYYTNAGAGMPHVAVYIGGGKAVHGGWNGGTTAVFSAYLGSGPTFIRVA